MSSKRHIIIGYPNSGKTTFLAALWHVLDAGSDTTSLILEKMTGDTTYLNEIMQTWLKCKQVPRTHVSSEEMVEMYVRDKETQDTFILGLPDFSGETFQNIYANRECKEQFVEQFKADGGILFFINADRQNDMNTVLDHIFDDDDSPLQDDHTYKDFDPRKVPEQTRIVDLLQLLQDEPFPLVRRRLVIAVSAWDVVADDGVNPQGWIKREMPLLAQYLNNNDQSFNTRYWGISAQGGHFTEEARQELLKLEPAKRVNCLWDETSNSDMTQPLSWLSADDS